MFPNQALRLPQIVNAGLIPGGSDRLSIRYYPIGDGAQVRADDGALDVLRWGISHVASVGEPADVSAGDELGSTDGYDLEVEVHWVEQEVIMPDETQKLTELASTLPGLISESVFGRHLGRLCTAGGTAPAV